MGLVSINHTSFTVSDAAAIAEWYCEMLDFTIVSVDTRPQDYSEKVTGIPGADLRIVYIWAVATTSSWSNTWARRGSG